ncbi:hypothetical protein EHN07_18450 [Buttiauxella warmboldiae]|uniref:Uncharacterized protein n=1 Tax=Buttiauxella warmboldiae TaxID=82993 RepID=A0A3N5D5F9_9ENTR|nr:hypothetical protein EHN07_18450 [Buttiauxella warmboldiae]
MPPSKPLSSARGECQCLPAVSSPTSLRQFNLPVAECKKPRNVLRGSHPLPGREKLIQQRC